MEKADCGTEADGFEHSVRQNSQGLSEEQIDSVLKEIGELPESEGDDDAPPF